MKSSRQKSDCKNSKNSVESADKPINFTLSLCFGHPQKIQVVLVPHFCFFLIKYLLVRG